MSAPCSFLLLPLFRPTLSRWFTFDVKSAKPHDRSRRASRVACNETQTWSKLKHNHALNSRDEVETARGSSEARCCECVVVGDSCSVAGCRINSVEYC